MQQNIRDFNKKNLMVFKNFVHPVKTQFVCICVCMLVLVFALSFIHQTNLHGFKPVIRISNFDPTDPDSFNTDPP